MWMNLAVIAVAGMVAYWGSTQGFFGAVLHFACVVVAGAIAFALWEPIYYLGLARIDKPLFYDAGWGISLILTFAILRLVLQIATDKACPANVNFGEGVNFVGGIVAGACSGILTAGILLIGLQYVQGPSKLLGYQGWTLDIDGGVIKGDKLWVPVDDWTAWFYTQGSVSTMFSTNPIAKWQPRLAQQASLYRLSYDEGKSRMGMRPAGTDVKRVITLELNDPAAFIQDLPGVKHPQTGQRLTNGEVFALRTVINSASWDDDMLRLSKAQIRLIVRMQDGSYEPIHPHAFYQNFDTASPAQWRYVFDKDDVFATSVGVAADTPITFEFLVPSGATPHHLIVRNSRSMLPPRNQWEEGVPERDVWREMESGQL